MPDSGIKKPLTWDSLGLSSEALELVRKSGYTVPTPIQVDAIPIVLQGRDVIGSAQTGTGKTASFVLPMVERFMGRNGTYGLILSPTREIALQTLATLEIFGKPRGIKSISLIGGIDMKFDTIGLQTYPHIIVATPGRLCDHLDRGNVWLDFIEIVVLDEADQMLDLGFSDQLARITDDLPKTRQTLLFSATVTPMIQRLANRILKDPVHISIGKPLTAANAVEQRFVFVSESSKNSMLRRLIREEKGSIIVFTRSKINATKLWLNLHGSGVYEATYIHSDRAQAQREQALEEFKQGKFRILIATDVAGRGIHVDDVAHVVNYDLPREPEDYIHRIGRTGRADASGKATSFVTPGDKRVLSQIERMLGKEIRPEGSFDDSGGSRGHARSSHGGHSSSHSSNRRPPGPVTANRSPSPSPSTPSGRKRRRRRGGGGGSATRTEN